MGQRPWAPAHHKTQQNSKKQGNVSNLFRITIGGPSADKFGDALWPSSGLALLVWLVFAEMVCWHYICTVYFYLFFLHPYIPIYYWIGLNCSHALTLASDCIHDHIRSQIFCDNWSRSNNTKRFTHTHSIDNEFSREFTVQSRLRLQQ